MFQFIRNRRPAVIGLILGATVGLMVAIGYGGTSAWLCSGIRNCPASWEPFVLVSSIFFVGFTVAGVTIAHFGAKVYKIFDTALGSDKAREPSIGTTIRERSDDK